MSCWQPLDAELALWRAAGRRPTLWCRDDDACRDSPPLRRLLELAEQAALPIALAAIPAALERSLAAAVTQSRFAIVIQHGYAHRNHAPPDERKIEIGLHRAAGETLAELARGADLLQRAFGHRFVPILVPPWNRIAEPIVAELPGAGFRGLSTLGPRKARYAAPGLMQCNTHVDLIAWRDRSFIGIDAAVARVVGHLRARREASADSEEATGILTHHLDLSAAGWELLIELVTRAREGGALWIDVQSVFGIRERRDAHLRPISMKRT